MDADARRHLLNAIEEVRSEIVQREGERKHFAASWGWAMKGKAKR